jgi:hypothetical protein
MTLSISGDSITFPDLSTQLTAPSGFGFKNRIINGDMRIDQRNAGASGTASSYTIDRWSYYGSQASKATWQQNAGSIAPPVGFSKYLGATSSSAYSVTATDQFLFNHRVEGFNFSDMNWGTAAAADVTLSFRVYSSLTGTFGGAFQNATANRCYPFLYSIPTANTWTTITVVVAGDTTGTWVGGTNGVGFVVSFSLGTGATYSAAAGSWTGSSFITSATGATSVVGTSGATFFLTGVQLEKGSTATSFDYRDYGRELIMCQRYYQSTDKSGNVGFFGMPYTNGLGQAYGSAIFSGLMRSAPTVILFDSGSGNQVSQPGVAGNISATAGGITTLGFATVNRASGSFAAGGVVIAGYTASAEI